MFVTEFGMVGVHIPWMIPSLMWFALMISSDGTPYIDARAY